MSKFNQWSDLTSDLFAKKSPLHRSGILDQIKSEPVAFSDSSATEMTLPGRRVGEYWKVLEPQADVFTEEYKKSEGAAAYVRGDHSLEDLGGFSRIYFASSPSLTKMKLKALDANVKADIEFGIDPLSLGLWQSKIFKSQMPWSSDFKDKVVGCKLFRLSTLAYDMAGATPTQQLAILLGSLTHLVRNYEGQLSVEELFKMCSFEVSLTSNTLLGVAKIQALRLLLKRLIEVYETEAAEDFRIFAIASPRHLASREVSNNILRLASVNMAALMGGASGCVQLAPDTFSANKDSRVARNMDLILQKEAFLSQVDDPTLGSYSVDQACQAMAETSWNFFREIEGKEGLQHALSSGWLQKEMAYENQKATSRFLSQKDKMTGVNSYALQESLSAERPLIKGSDVRSIETWWVDYTDQSMAEKLCDVERAKPVQLSEFFEKWQFKMDEVKSRGNIKQVYLEIEPGLEGNSKTKRVQEILSLAGIETKQTLEGKKSPFCTVVIAADPEGAFVESVVEEIRARGKGLCLWAGERKFAHFDGFIGESTPLIELFELLFRNLGGGQ